MRPVLLDSGQDQDTSFFLVYPPPFYRREAHNIEIGALSCSYLLYDMFPSPGGPLRSDPISSHSVLVGSRPQCEKHLLGIMGFTYTTQGPRRFGLSRYTRFQRRYACKERLAF